MVSLNFKNYIMKFSAEYNIENENIQKLVKDFESKNISDPAELSILVYEYVRDTWYYSPLRLSLIPEEWEIEYLITRKKGHCIDKSIILITLLKALGIEARLGLAKVRNHIAAERVVAFLGTDILVPHGYVEILLDNKWVKATPAFNSGLCEKLGVDVLEFNGKDDSIFQKFGVNGDQFMEYIEDYGSFDKIPVEFIEELLLSHYPILKKAGLKMGTVIDMSGE